MNGKLVLKLLHLFEWRFFRSMPRAATNPDDAELRAGYPNLGHATLYFKLKFVK